MRGNGIIMGQIRVLIADDMSVARTLLQEVLGEVPEVQVVGAACNGVEAVAMTDKLLPNVIIMDVIMPQMDGIEATAAVRKRHPNIPIIMFSALTDTGTEATLDALAAGANDYVQKPSQAGHLRQALQSVKQELVPKILRWGKQSQRTEVPKGVLPPVAPSTPKPRRNKRGAEVLAIGVSTGGPNALAQLLQGLPASFPVPIVIVQHMPARFTPLLAQRLTASTPFTVLHGDQQRVLSPGTVILAPGDFHLTVARNGTSVVTRLNQDAPVNSCRPSVDVLFDSVAAVYRESTLAVVLTGMGSDGLQGARTIQKNGGRVAVQDQASSVVWGMPGAIATAGLADEILSLTDLPPYIMAQVQELARV